MKNIQSARKKIECAVGDIQSAFGGPWKGNDGIQHGVNKCFTSR